jgi:hypothetical protein
VHANDGSTENGGANQSQLDMSALKIDNEKFRKTFALLYSFGRSSILEND